MTLPLQNRTLWTTCLLVTAIVGVGKAQPRFDASSDSDSSEATFSQPPQLGSAFSQPGPSAVPSYGTAPPRLPSSPSDGPSEPSDVKPTIHIQYVVERPVWETVNQGGRVIQLTRYVKEVRSAEIATDTNLDELDLPPNGKRAAVLTVTAARHEELLQKLKEAESEEEKKEATEALKTNYTEHYAIETWWREQRLAELEDRLKEMREQVKQRQDAQEKYIDAAMTIAELWAQGIAIEPPKPGSAAEHGSATALTVPTTAPRLEGGSWSPPASASDSSPTMPGPGGLTPIPVREAK